MAGWLARHASALASALGGALWFFWLGYGPTLAPSHVAWMYRADWAAYHWGFSFFRNADWAFPLGSTPNLFHPFGTSIGFTDANPWAATFFKLLSPILPVDFQFSGPWFLACFMLQGVFGAKLTAAFTRDRLLAALGGLLFVVTPILPARADHVALCALFFVTAGLWLNVVPIASRQEALRTLSWAACLLVWVAGTHGYLSVMLLALVLALVARFFAQRLLSWRETALGVLAAFGLTLGTYWLFGFLGWKATDLTAEGFGEFNADLTTLVNPQKWSRFWPGLAQKPRQWEGFAYLGTGVLALLLVASVGFVRRPVPLRSVVRRGWALAVVLGLMALYALSARVSFLGDTVLDLSALYRPFAALTGIFRTSGRFVWPLHLALVALAIAGTVRLPPWVARVALTFALLLQVVELDKTRLKFVDQALGPLASPAWQSVGQDYAHLRLVPVQILWVCKYDARLVNTLSDLAYRQRLTFNSGNFMRKEPDVARLCRTGLLAGEAIAPDTIYVVDRPNLRAFQARGATCGRLDGLQVCVEAGRNTTLRAALAAHLLP